MSRFENSIHTARQNAEDVFRSAASRLDSFRNTPEGSVAINGALNVLAIGAGALLTRKFAPVRATYGRAIVTGILGVASITVAGMAAVKLAKEQAKTDAAYESLHASRVDWSDLGPETGKSRENARRRAQLADLVGTIRGLENTIDELHGRIDELGMMASHIQESDAMAY